MLQMKVDLIPNGDRKKKSTILSMTIINDGSSPNKDFGNYCIKVKKDKQTKQFMIYGVKRRGIMKFMSDIMLELQAWT